jgi:hypothetical protein
MAGFAIIRSRVKLPFLQASEGSLRIDSRLAVTLATSSSSRIQGPLALRNGLIDGEVGGELFPFVDGMSQS